MPTLEAIREEEPTTLLQMAPTHKEATERAVALRVEGVSKTFMRSVKPKNTKQSAPTWDNHTILRDLIKGMLPKREKREPKRVVDNVSFVAYHGETLGVLGPNGCGKSTLVRMISTLLIPDEGKIEVFGLDVVRQAIEVRHVINRVSVDAAFFKKLSALENLLYTARLYDIPQKVAMEKAWHILHLLGFDEENLTNSMEQLSRGQQQKVAISRAFLTTPQLLLLDEPTTGLDPKSKKDVEAFIKKLRASQSSTILLTTHDMAEAEALCDRIAILNKGLLVALGTVQELKEQFRKPGATELPTLEEVFIALAGEKLEDADEDENEGVPSSPLLEDTK